MQVTNNGGREFDRINAALAGLVFIGSFIVYSMTVQQTFSFWDAGEFVACSYILGIPHPPGTPLFILIGRLFSLIPMVEDISHRINYLSVIGSAATAMMSYLLIVKFVRYFFADHATGPLNRMTAYIGGVAGGFLVAFGTTNWANSVETEVYGPSMAIAVLLVWLTVKYYETQGTRVATRIMILTFYIAAVGIGLHMTQFVVVPVIALFYILKQNATKRDWMMVCGFAMAGLLLVNILAGQPNAYSVYKILLGVLLVGLVIALYKRINWGIVVAIGAVSSVMVGFGIYLELMAPFTLLYKLLPGASFSWDIFTLKTLVFWAIIVGGVFMAIEYERKGIKIKWREGLTIIILGFVGFSVHQYLPIRSQHAPRINENNPSRDWDSFVNMLDRKQYGQISMTERMFNRRGSFENQFGRHPHMGFWSYFEEQYSAGGWTFIPFFLLGLLGVIVAIRKRLELGLPFFVLLLVSSIGLILYMNFADGTRFNPATGDAYLEVRNRDYFFTPAFVFFGIAMGMGVSALIMILRETIAKSNISLQKSIVYASSLMVLIPGVTLAHNFHINDRSKNEIPFNYAANILDSCEPNAILFTSGDNDTFPVWCLQEVYNYRKDVRCVNLSLLNTDWYVAHMKNVMGVPISLSDEQIYWNPYEVRGQGGEIQTRQRPDKKFRDKPRGRMTYLEPTFFGGRIVKVQDMMVDEIVIQNAFRDPIYFTAPPYAESPLKLRQRSTMVGLIYKLQRDTAAPAINTERGYELFEKTYKFTGYENSDVFRDDNATGVFLGVGLSAVRLYDALMRGGDTTKALALMDQMIAVYPEYWQFYLQLSAYYTAKGDSAKTDSLFTMLHDTLSAFLESNPNNLFYEQDLGLIKAELGTRRNDTQLIDEGIDLMKDAFERNPNSGYAFRKLITTLYQNQRSAEMREAAALYREYGQNQSDPIARQILGIGGP